MGFSTKNLIRTTNFIAPGLPIKTKGLDMGFLFGGDDKAPPPPPTPPPPAPTMQDPNIAKAGQDARKRARMAAGFGSTIQTGTQGLTEPAVTTGKSLLGQ